MGSTDEEVDAQGVEPPERHRRLRRREEAHALADAFRQPSRPGRSAVPRPAGRNRPRSDSAPGAGRNPSRWGSRRAFRPGRARRADRWRSRRGRRRARARSARRRARCSVRRGRRTGRPHRDVSRDAVPPCDSRRARCRTRWPGRRDRIRRARAGACSRHGARAGDPRACRRIRRPRGAACRSRRERGRRRSSRVWPAPQGGQRPQLSWNEGTTRWPISSPRTPSPRLTTSATHSWPRAKGGASGRAVAISRGSISQRATASGRTSASSSPSSRGSGTSRHSIRRGPMQVSCRMRPD